MKENKVISAKVTSDLYEMMQSSKDAYFEKQKELDLDVRNSWKRFIVMLYRNWIVNQEGAE